MSEESQHITQNFSDASVPDLRDKVIQAIKSIYDPEIPV
ncbi:MAG: FeS assembly SUF system protein, partial [Bacteroidota bacterium]